MIVSKGSFLRSDSDLYFCEGKIFINSIDEALGHAGSHFFNDGHLLSLRVFSKVKIL